MIVKETTKIKLREKFKLLGSSDDLITNFTMSRVDLDFTNLEVRNLNR